MPESRANLDRSVTGKSRSSDDPGLTVPTPSSSLALSTGTDEEGACYEGITLPPGGLDQAAPPDGLPAYMASRGRDLRIDLLRGYFVVAMIVDHVRGTSPLYLLTGGNRFFTSAAEGFILTSGLVAGLVYRRLIARIGLVDALYKLLQRAMTLYLLTAGVTLVFLPLSEELYLPWAQGLDMADSLGLVVSVLTLHRTYYLIDVMLLYTALFIFVPLAFILMERGRTVVVLGASWLLWALFQIYPDYAALPWPIAGNYLFDFSAWQVLFFSGLVLGYHNERIRVLDCRETRVALGVAAAAAALLLVTFVAVDPIAGILPDDWGLASPLPFETRVWLQDMVFSKVSLRPGRLVASAITFTFLFLAVTVYWQPVKRAVGWLLVPLGQSALYAYTAHIVAAAAVALVLLPLELESPGPWWLNAAIQLASVLVIWLLVQRRVLAPNPATQRVWNAVPLVLAAAAVVILPFVPSPSYPGVVEPPVQEAATQARVPRRFGTPIPKEAVTKPRPTPTGPAVPTPTPTPAPHLLASDVAEAEARLGPYRDGLEGALIERWFYSAELDRDMPYVVYLPPDYGAAGRRYPVLYMLHGRGGHRDEWVSYGIAAAVDREIRTGSIAPMIVVLPQGDTGFWADHADDGPRWGAYLVLDLVPHIDATFRTLREASARAIGGHSMGGWGALHNAFTHPEVFGVVGAHSPSLRTDDGSLSFLGAGAAFAAKDPVILARTAPKLPSLKIWVDTSSEDPWLEATEELHSALEWRGVSHTWRVFPGIHGYEYWQEHLLDYVRFYAEAMALR